MAYKTGLHVRPLGLLYTCAVCNKFYDPYKITQKTCSAKCRNTLTSRITVDARAEKQRAQTYNKNTYRKLRGRHEHRVKAEEMLGRALLPGEIVHHKDGNKLNNSFENLEVLPNQSVHAKTHRVNGKFSKVHNHAT